MTVVLIIFICISICFISSLANFINIKNELSPSYRYNYDKNENREHFQWDPLWVGKTSLDCYGETTKDCMNYSNCGLCYKDGQRKCLPGDSQGPFFEERCKGWEHTNYYDRHIFGEKVTTLRPSWDAVLPGYETVYPSPIAVQTLQ